MALSPIATPTTGEEEEAMTNGSLDAVSPAAQGDEIYELEHLSTQRTSNGDLHWIMITHALGLQGEMHQGPLHLWYITT